MPHVVCIRVSRSGGALHVGATSSLPRRMARYRAGCADPHTARCRITRLVWFEEHDRLDAALARARSLKRWRRAWKDALVHEANPDWRDLWAELPPL